MKRKKPVELIPITREMAVGQWVFDLLGANEESHWHEEKTPARSYVQGDWTVEVEEGVKSSWYRSRKECPVCLITLSVQGEK